MQSVININPWTLAGFSLLLLIPLAINRHFQLNLAREATLALLRMTLQLILVGAYLEFLFRLNSPLLNISWLLIMLLIGTSAIIDKTHLPLRPLFLPVAAGLLLSLLPLLLIMLLAVLQPSPLYSAQYLIPLAGLLLGNSMNGNIVALQRLFTAYKERREEYEAALVLGATPYQASLPFMQSAIALSLAPILATLATTGLVTLPGMMTGQILGGTDPMLAIRYQWLIMIAIFVMLSVSVTVTLQLSVRLLITPTGRVMLATKRPTST